MSTRIYAVQTKGKPAGPDDTVLVEATTAIQALRLVTDKLFSVHVTSAKEAMALAGQGCAVHKVETTQETPDVATDDTARA